MAPQPVELVRLQGVGPYPKWVNMSRLLGTFHAFSLYGAHTLLSQTRLHTNQHPKDDTTIKTALITITDLVFGS